MNLKIGYFLAESNFEDRLSILLKRDNDVIDMNIIINNSFKKESYNFTYNYICEMINQNSLNAILITSELIEKLSNNFFLLVSALVKATSKKDIKLIFITQNISYKKHDELVQFSLNIFPKKLKKLIDNIKNKLIKNIILFDADIILSVSEKREKNIFDTVYPVKSIQLNPKNLSRNKLNVLDIDQIYEHIYSWLNLDQYNFTLKYTIISFQDFNKIIKSHSREKIIKKFPVFNNYISQHNCAFEVIYRMKPIEMFPRYSIANLRIELGKRLYNKIPKNIWKSNIDFIVPVPETGKYYAQGLAMISKKPYIEAIFRNPKVQRSFDISDQIKRKAALYEKLLIIEDLVRDKSICLVDEAIFTGATLKTVCNQLRDVGVKSIYIAIPTPPCYRQCHVKMLPQRNMLLEYQRSENLSYYFDSDEVYYGTVEEFDAELYKHGKFCYNCFQK